MDLSYNRSRVQNPKATRPHGIPLVDGQAPDNTEQYPFLDPLKDSNDRNNSKSENSGRLSLDRKGIGHTKNQKLLKCSSQLKLSTFNVRTLNHPGQLDELVDSMSLHSIDVLAIQEHRLYHPDESLLYKSLDSYQLVTSSATKNSVNATIGGVGFLLSPRASSNVTNVESISSRIMVIEFSGNPKLTVVCTYSPTNCSPFDEIEEFYSSLQNLLSDIPHHNFLTVAGDFNAKMAAPDVLFSFNNTTNRNGEYLLNILEEFNLFSSNNSFMKSKNQLWTFEYPNGTRAQIDYILFRKKWRNSVKDSRSFSTFSSVASDHRIVSSKVKLSLRISKPSKPHPLKRVDWVKVTRNADISGRFAVNVFNRFTPLYSEVDKDNLDSAYSSLIKITEEVALSTLPQKEKANTLKPSSDPSVLRAREKLSSASKIYHSKPTRTRKANLEAAKRELDSTYSKIEAASIESKLFSFSEHHTNNDSHSAWKLINELRGKSPKASIQLKGGSSKKRLENWLSHFSNLLGKPPTLPSHLDLPKEQIAENLLIPVSPFTLDELIAVLKTTKSSKAFGPDNIPPIIWKDNHFHQLLLDISNICFEDNICPHSWLSSTIIPVPKKGDLSLATNYRGISLLPIAAKIYNKLILNRIRPFLDPILRMNQNGFRKGRSTLSQILTLRRVLEEARNYNIDAVLVFVDFKKAFDSVDRNKMFNILALYGIPSKFINAIRLLYSNTSAKVQTPDGETSSFSILAGILQGDTLAPFLFIIVVDYIMRISVDKIKNCGFLLEQRQSTRHPAKYLTDTDFADDIALISNSVLCAQSLLQSLESAANCVGLYLNESKTEFFTTKVNNLDEVKTSSGSKLKRVDDYKYLGSYISSSEKDFKTRKALAWVACNKLHHLWVSNRIQSSLKIKVFKVAIEPILLYGSETWCLSRKMEKELDGTYTRLLRRVKNLSWRDHPNKNQIYGSIKPPSLLLKAKRAQFAGHCHRASSEIISSILLWKPRQRVKRSRKLTFSDTLSRDTETSYQDLATAMSDRDFWRGKVKSIVSTAVER